MDQIIPKGEELLDHVDKEDNIIGTVLRSIANSDPSFTHREVATILFNSKGETLLAQRSLQKKVSPGWWDIASAGHVDAGEDPKVCAQRELVEELGISINLTFYKKIFNQIENESRIIYCYYGIYDGSKIVFDKDEVQDTAWISLEELDSFDLKHLYDKEYWSHSMIYEVAKHLYFI